MKKRGTCSAYGRWSGDCLGRSARKRGLSREQISILVACDRPGTTTEYWLTDSRKGAIMAVLNPLLPADAVVTSNGRHAIGAWHIQNVNSYHGQLKGWMRRFHGVANSYLENYLEWFRALDRTPRPPAQRAQLLNLAVGAYRASSVSLSCKAAGTP